MGIIRMTAADYREQLIALLPPSRQLDVNVGSNFWLLLDGLAQEFSRTEASSRALLKEADPRLTYDLLNDYESMLGLPASCAPVAQTLDGRRKAVHAKMTERGGQSKDYFIRLAQALGYTITISEFQVHNVGSAVTAPMNGAAWRFAFQVNADKTVAHTATVISGVSEGLRSWGFDLLECAVNQDKPAHTHAIYSYT